MMDSILVGITLLTRITLVICAVAIAAVIFHGLLESQKKYDRWIQQQEEIAAMVKEYVREHERKMDRRRREREERIRDREEKKDAGEEGGSGSC